MITKLKFIDVFREKNIIFFNSSDIQKMFPVKNKNTLKHLLRRLKKGKIIERLIKNKYLFLHSTDEVSDFAIANFLIIPSYVSLDSALSYYGILSQFSYRISSITIFKPRIIKIREKTFIYSKIKSSYFRDFVVVDNFLIATREKAIFDYLYFIYKGLRPKNSLNELKPFIKKKSIKKYILENAEEKVINFLERHDVKL